MQSTLMSLTKYVKCSLELKRSLRGMKVPFASNYKNHFIVHKVHIEAKKYPSNCCNFMGRDFAHLFSNLAAHNIILFQYVNKMCIHIYYNQVNCTSSINVMNNEWLSMHYHLNLERLDFWRHGTWIIKGICFIMLKTSIQHARWKGRIKSIKFY